MAQATERVEVSEGRWAGLWGALGRDVRWAARSLRRSPGYLLAVVLTLGLGIGANTAVFSLIHGILLRPLPFADPDRLVRLDLEARGVENAGSVGFSIQEVLDLRAEARSFDEVAEYHGMTFTLFGHGEPQRVLTGVVSAGYFELLGVEPLVGRTFTAEDDAPGADAVLVLSNAFWKRAFGSDPAVVGQVFQMNDKPHTVVGVLPPVPLVPQERDVYMPTLACPFRAAAETQRAAGNREAFRALVVLARLGTGSALEPARQELSSLLGRFRGDHPDSYPRSAGHVLLATPLFEILTRDARPTLWLLLATVGVVLLLACANVANLTLARLLRRERELAVRSCLGAGRAGLVRGQLVEGALLATAGAVVGLVLARGGLGLLSAFLSRFTPRAEAVSIDGSVLAFTSGIALATALAFGLLPLVSGRFALATVLGGAGRSTDGAGRQRLRAGLVVVQVALSVSLLAGAGLMLRSVLRLQAVDPGVDTRSIVTASIPANWSVYRTGADRQRLYDGIVARLRERPEVESVAFSSGAPLSEQGFFPNPLAVEGRPLPEGTAVPSIDVQVASEDFFATLGIPVVRGRVFSEADDADSLPVAVLSEAAVGRFLGGDEPLGRRLSLDGGQTWLDVVGVVGDVRLRGLENDAPPVLYTPVRQTGFGGQLLVRTRVDARGFVPELKRTVWAVEPEQPVAAVTTLADLRRDQTASPRLTAVLLALFAAVALAVTATGIGGVLAFSVAQRTREIGVRLALGARRFDVVARVLARGAALTAAGVAIGVAGAIAFGRLLGGLLFATPAADPATLVAVAVTLVAVALLAGAVPALRASRVQPTVALRQD